jgi:two-component sensor histidine kinase
LPQWPDPHSTEGIVISQATNRTAQTSQTLGAGTMILDHLAAEETTSREAVIRAVLAECGDCIKILDLEGRLQFMSEGAQRAMEVDDFGRFKGRPWSDFWTDAENIQARKAVESARRGKTAHFRGAADTAKGNPRYWDVRLSPIFGTGGQPLRLLLVSRDVTAEWRVAADLREATERQKILTDELQHRIKNTLAMVGAIANQTMRGDEVDAARDAFAARLVTLSHAHDILTQTSWLSAPIREIVEGALAPHRTGDRRIQVSGPDLRLNPKQALALALAVNELATNAVKYGALSNNVGTVDIAWSTPSHETIPSFIFKWNESNGPPVVPPTRTGFGSRLIERVLANDFGAKVCITYPAGGVVCKLLAPLANLKAPQA